MPRAPRVRGLRLALAATLLTTGGCGSRPPPDPAGTSPAEADSPVLAAGEGSSLDYPDGIVAGTVVLEHRCLVIDGAVAFWPPGTTWDDATQTVVLDDGARVAVGDETRFGGGFVPSEVAERFDGSTQAAVDRCVEAVGATSMALIGEPLAPGDQAAEAPQDDGPFGTRCASGQSSGGILDVGGPVDADDARDYASSPEEAAQRLIDAPAFEDAGDLALQRVTGRPRQFYAVDPAGSQVARLTVERFDFGTYVATGIERCR